MRFCGVNELGIQLAKNIEGAPEMGLRLAGFYDDRPVDRTTECRARVGSCVGNIEELVHRARRGVIDTVLHYISDGGLRTEFATCLPSSLIRRQRLHCARLLCVRVAARSLDERERFAGSERVRESAARLPGGCETNGGIWFFGSLLLAAAAVPMAVVAIAIKVTSRGPVFFCQCRYGFGWPANPGVEFRTMKCWRQRRKCAAGDKG